MYLSALAGISFISGVYQAQLALRARRADSGALALASFLLVASIIFSIALYQAASAAGSLALGRLQMFATEGFCLCLLWLFALPTRIRLPRLLLPFGACFTALGIGQLISPSLVYRTVRGIVALQLPWGERLSMLDGDYGVAGYAFAALVLGMFVALFAMACRQLSRADKAPAWRALAAFLVLFLATMHDAALIAFHLRSLPLRETALTATLVILGVRAADEMANTAALSDRVDRTERRLAAIFDSTVQLIGLWDTEGRVISANAAALRFAGASLAEMKGTPAWSLPVWSSLPEEQAALKKAVARVRNGESVQRQSRHAARDGSIRTFAFSLSPVRGARGSVEFMVAESRDITALVDAEEKIREQAAQAVAQNRALEQARSALAQSQKEIASILFSAYDIIYRLDRAGAITFVNDAVRRYGHDPVQMLGRPILDYVHPDDRRNAVYRLNERRTGPRSTRSLELRLFAAETRGETAAAATVSPLPVFLVQAEGLYVADAQSGKKAFVGTQGIARDITERRIAERAVADSEERLRAFFEQTLDAVTMTDEDGRIVEWNPAAEQMTLIPRGEAVGARYVDMMVRLLPRERRTPSGVAALRGHLWETMRREGPGTAPPAQVEMERADGSRIIARQVSFAVRTARGKRFAAIAQDVTEGVRAEEENKRIEAKLFHAQKMEAIGTLTSGIAHDFNNILVGITGSLSLLRAILSTESIGQTEEAMECLDTALQAASRAAALIKQLLAIGRKQEMELAAVDVNACLRSVEALCRNGFPKSVVIEVGHTEERMWVRAEPSRLEQALLNVCLNAMHAMTIMRAPDARQGGTLLIECMRVENSAELRKTVPEAGSAPRYVRMSITDTGVGMNEETRRRIFEPFFTTKGANVGTGLGLSMTDGTVRQLGGFISVFSSPGIGTSFDIYLPEIEADASGEGERAEAPATPAGTGTILVIDDERTILRLAERILERGGYRVITAVSAEQGIERFRMAAGSISAVVLDMSMPEMSGIEAARILKRIDPDVRIILSSGLIDEEWVRSSAQEVKALLMKPYTAERLCETVRLVLALPPSPEKSG